MCRSSKRGQILCGGYYRKTTADQQREYRLNLRQVIWSSLPGYVPAATSSKVGRWPAATSAEPKSQQAVVNRDSCHGSGVISASIRGKAVHEQNIVVTLE